MHQFLKFYVPLQQLLGEQLWQKSSSGSTPPLGTTHLSGTFELETSNTYKTVILEDLYLQQVLIFMKILEEVGDIYREVQQFKPHSLCKVYNVHTSIM